MSHGLNETLKKKVLQGTQSFRVWDILCPNTWALRHEGEASEIQGSDGICS